MKRLLPLLLIAGCDSSAPAPAPPANSAAPMAAQAPPPTEEAIAESRAAAEALRLYYDRIASGDYRAAWDLREQRPGLSYERFAASFERYEDYRATVGAPTLPAEQDGTLWVEAPVQLYGRMRGGRPFGSVGRVVMKRAAGTRAWKVAA